MVPLFLSVVVNVKKNENNARTSSTRIRKINLGKCLQAFCLSISFLGLISYILLLFYDIHGVSFAPSGSKSTY